jgi:hypothetical protein
MENLLQSMLQNINIDNFNVNNENMFDGCLNYLMSSELTEEQYDTIMEVCQDKIDTIKSNKYVEMINNIIEQVKLELNKESTSELKMYQYLNSITNIKAYINSDNDINDPKPSIEYVIETNYQDKNITYFYELVYNNIENKKEVLKSVSVSDIKDEMNIDDNSEESAKMDECYDDSLLNFDDNDCIEKLSKAMEWSGSEETLIKILNTIYTVFEEEETISW